MFYTKKFSPSPWKITIPVKISWWLRSTNNSPSEKERTIAITSITGRERTFSSWAIPVLSRVLLTTGRKRKDGYVSELLNISWPYCYEGTIIYYALFLDEHGLKELLVGGFALISPHSTPALLSNLCLGKGDEHEREETAGHPRASAAPG